MKSPGVLLTAVCLSILLAGGLAHADVKLPAVISDSMVLQQNTTAPIWGWAEPDEEIKVKASWLSPDKYAKADKDGKWKVEVSTPKTPGPHTISIAGNNEIILKHVLAGEVWVCSGQSNMEWTVAARYAWTNDAEPNLFNKANLPASSFRTDNLPGVTVNNR